MSAKLEHINVFNKGMNTDTSDAIMPAELYRYAENLRLITKEGSSSGELLLIEGEKVLKDFKSFEIDKIKGITSIRNYIIIVGTGKCNGGYGDCVWYCIKNKDDISNPVCVFGPSAEPFGDNVSLVTRYESESNIKIYIADGKHPLMNINIKHEGDNYTKIEDIANQLNIPLVQISTEKSNILDSVTSSPVVLYTYSVYTLGSLESGLAPLSKPVVFDDIKTSNPTPCNSVTLTINDSSNLINKFIKIYKIAYTINGQVPDVYLLYDGQYTEGFSFRDVGTYIKQLTIEELNSVSQVLFKPLLIESKNDYLFAANVEYIQEEVDNQFKSGNGEFLVTAEYTFEQSGNWQEIARYGKNVRTYNKSVSIKSFKTGEWYRFGIVLYDKQGRRSSVIQIKDILVGNNIIFDVNRINVSEDLLHIVYNTYVKVNPVRVRVRLTIDDSVRDLISGWELVRCNRTIEDSISVCQGIVGRAQLLYINVASEPRNINDRFMFPYMTLQNYENLKPDNLGSRAYFKSCDDLLMFASPEQCYNQDELKSILKNKNLSIKSRASYNIPEYNSNVFPNSSLYDDFVYPGDATNSSSSQTGERGQVFRYEYDNVLQCGFESGGYILFSVLYSLYNGDSTALRLVDGKKIKNFAFTESPDPFKVVDGTAKIDEARTQVGDLSFVNYDSLIFYKNGYYDASDLGEMTLNHVGDILRWYTCTTGKKCMLLLLDSKINSNDLGINREFLPISVVDIVKDNNTPYGGINDPTALSLSVFYSTGEYFTDTDVTSDSGDCYLGMFVYNSAHTWYHPTYVATMYPTIYIVPVESSIDLTKTYGDLYPDLQSPKEYFQDVPVLNLNGYNLDNYAYMYNTAYSSYFTSIPVYPSKTEYIDTNRYDTRIHYSSPKTNGEHIDSWLKFSPMNFIDADTRFGEITDMKLFRDTLVFWQKEATGILSVNERTIIKDANSSNILLGNSDVMLRYDYLTTQYGMVPYLKARTLSDKALYWWDGYKKEIIQYAGGNVVLPMKKEKTVSAYINGILSLKEIPTLLYDDKYSEILINLEDRKSLVYNEFVLQFTSVYQVWFDHALNVEGSVLFTRNTKMYKWNEVEKNSEYIPRLDYVVNPSSQIVKVFDNMEIGMGEGFYYDLFYNGPQNGDKPDYKLPIKIIFNTPKQTTLSDIIITKREYDFKCAIPRAREEGKVYDSAYGNRMRGRVMNCSLESNSSNRDFSLQYIITKFRISYA